MSATHVIAGNELMLLKNGTEFFPQLCADIDAAKHSVYLEAYIFAADETGEKVRAALQRAAQRGLAVHVLLDGYGSAKLPAHCLRQMQESGVAVHLFRRDISPFTLKRSRMRRLRRLHRKLVAIDGELAFVGGINVIDDAPQDQHLELPRLDYAVRVRGELAGEVQAAMQRLWEMVTWATFRKRIRLQGWRIYQRWRRAVEEAPVRLLLRDNIRHRRDIERAYLRAIATAEREIIIANAYFLPGRRLRRALVQASRRGVRVVLLLQGKVEYRMQHYATLALYDYLIGGGVEVYEYQPSFLHAKVAVIDGQWATVGSFNMDPFSLLLALEANLVIRDEGFAQSLRTSLWQTIAAEAQRVHRGHTGTGKRLLAHLSYALIRFVIGLLGLSSRH